VTWPLNLGGREYNEGDVLESCTIITTEANSLMAKIHDRMPVILDPENYDAWLDPKIQDTTILQALLKPFPSEKMQSWPVARIVNKVGDDDTENCIKEVKAHP
jgi:putative SOS response-associated peptidase YedK